MERIVIMSWHDSNIAGYEWVIDIELSQRTNNIFSLRALQIEAKKIIYKSPIIYPINNGNDLMNALIKLFQNDLISEMKINWNEIMIRLAIPFPSLCRELTELVIKFQNEKKEKSKDINNTDVFTDKSLNDWLGKAKWPRSTIRDPLGLGALVENSRRKKAVYQYLESYFSQTKSLPIGKHLINESISENGYESIPKNFKFIVTFPSKRPNKIHKIY